MKILVACEESQAVCKAFRKQGHESYSCDIQDCSGGHPEWHIKGCALKEAYSGKYDMLIAFPPCTFLSVVGAPHLYKGGKINLVRHSKGMAARAFFMALYNAPIKHISIENPTPMKCFNLPDYSQAIQPYMFGHPFLKRTLLWLKNLPPLKPTNVVDNPVSTSKANWFNKGGKNRQKNRSKTFLGIADAMSIQWSNPIWEEQLTLFDL